PLRRETNEPALEENLHHLRSPRLDGESECSVADGIGFVWIGMSFEEETNKAGFQFLRGDHCGRQAFLIGEIGVGTALDQQTGHLGLSRTRAEDQMEGGIAVTVLAVDPSAGIK